MDEKYYRIIYLSDKIFVSTKIFRHFYPKFFCRISFEIDMRKWRLNIFWDKIHLHLGTFEVPDHTDVKLSENFFLLVEFFKCGFDWEHKQTKI